MIQILNVGSDPHKCWDRVVREIGNEKTSKCWFQFPLQVMGSVPEHTDDHVIQATAPWETVDILYINSCLYLLEGYHQGLYNPISFGLPAKISRTDIDIQRKTPQWWNLGAASKMPGQQVQKQ